MTSRPTLYCSFCGKSQHEALRLVAGPGVFICEECVDLVAEVVRQAREKHAARKSEITMGHRSLVVGSTQTGGAA